MSMSQVYYLYAQDPVFHQVAYGILTLGTICRGFYVMERDLRPKLSQRNPTECDRYMRDMYKLAATGPYHLSESPGVPVKVSVSLTLGLVARHPHVLGRLLSLEHGQHLLPPPHHRQAADAASVVGGAGRPWMVAYPDWSR